MADKGEKTLKANVHCLVAQHAKVCTLASDDVQRMKLEHNRCGSLPDCVR